MRRSLAPYEADEPLAASFRAKQLQAMLRLTPLSMLVNLFNAGFLVYRLAAQSVWLWGWLLVLLFMAYQGLAAWYRAQHRNTRQTASRKAMRRAFRHALSLGALWGALPALLLSSVEVQDQQMLIIISCGMICAGGFALVTVPAAAIAYVLVMTAGSMVGLLRTSLPGAEILFCLLVAYSLIVVASVQVMAKSYGSRLVAEADAAHKQQIVGLLLRDFEENSSDFLWELAPSGQLGHASGRLNRALQFDPQQYAAFSLVALIARTHLQQPSRVPADAGHYLGQLQAALSTPLPFRDLLVPVVIGDALRWWALTAKPVWPGSPGAQGTPVAPGWRGVGADVTDRKHAEDAMHRLAHFDALTGLANRRHFQHRLQQLCGHDGSTPGSAALLCIDMDNFKRVNDAYGHANGDLLLKAVAQRMTSTIRGRDLVARLGGDEFAILLDGVTEVDEARCFATRLMQAIEQPCDLSGISFTPHTSMGIAFLPRDGQQPDEILHHADLALYEAKARGRRQAQFFSMAMDEKAQRRIALEDGLRQALAQHAMHLVYQPQISLRTHQITGVEALLRWSSPRFGNVSPAEFIPVAEEAGLIRDIGLWVLETACTAAHQLPAGLLVAVNLSACQFDDELLVDKILEVVARSGLPAERLELEITESVFLKDTEDVLTALHRLRAAGIRIALDDFGVGYSSLAYLRSFPFDKLKIDRSFVMAILQSAESQAIVRSVIDLASALHMETTAEGIETAEQAALLTQLACTTGQGFHFARPLPLEAATAFAATHLAPGA
ncbi:diguanylate cyclase (GGDEF) domain-containing protein [Rhodoferax sp. OV413]|uniref:putative bifunctional diguanylate cyclase/phosphodiesterase n=1 Tax=Rhodoferax sp. OV413 TaxID=1855285 RepID=UPI0008805292|nr:bifunctional diguanylate cyclase/phosphodiesterase [Rhodoferax sp. OV413]SDO21955.1 diguanylate cyclase (GGDEF) domain-containing protein [Rhodoferax sp. OV413]